VSAGAAPAAGSVRPARAADLPALAAIERAAGALFADAGIAGAFLAETTPAERLREAHADGLLWVATDPGDRPVGFALASVLDSGPHLEELDVHPDFGRRGLGAALVAAVLDWARPQDLPVVVIPGADHFFHSRLSPIRALVLSHRPAPQ